MSRRAPSIGGVVLGTVLMSLAACGGGEESSTTSDELLEITIGVSPIAATAPLPIGIEKGFFEDEGLEVNLNTTIAVPAIPSAVVSGDLDAGWSAWPAEAAYATQDLPIRVAVTLASGGDSLDTSDLILVALSDSDLDSAEDLEGKSIALASSGTNPESVLRAIATDAGVDPSSISHQIMDYPNMPAAIRSGQVDGAMMSEPFVTALEDTDDVELLGGTGTVSSDRPASTIIVSASTWSEDSDLVERIQRAVARSVDYASENPDEVRSTLTSVYGTPAELAETMRLPAFWVGDWPTIDQVQGVADGMRETGVLTEQVDLEEYLLPEPPS